MTARIEFARYWRSLQQV